jgi:phosphoribosyl 1,2-cyclic phosphodiesterase
MSLRLCVLGSGSGGNCTLVDSGRTRILIDAARLGQRYIIERLGELGVRIEDIDGILATHVHGDHVDGGVTYPLCNKYSIPLYVHSKSVEDLARRSKKFINLDRAGLLRTFESATFSLRELNVMPFSVPHGNGGWNSDVVGHPVGFRITLIDGAAETSIAYTTDLGEVSTEIENAMLGADALVLESNHDVESELNSSRPRFLVDWVIGPKGHLSNEQSSRTVMRLASRSRGKTKYIVLAHLSEDCNTPSLALETALHALETVGASETRLFAAAQRQPTPEIIL